MRFRKPHASIPYLLLLAVALFTQACAHHFAVPAERPLRVYAAAGTGQDALHRWAPLFAAHGFKENDNRIGRPVVRSQEGHGGEEIAIDTDQPVVYTLQRTFTTPRGTYTNLIYRIHFPRIPFSLIPFNLTAGGNPGLLVVITLDRRQQPVLVTTVHTCGCYLAIVPTAYLPPETYPPDWQEAPLELYGETLPPRLDLAGVPSPGVLVHLRPGVHRVMDLEVIPADNLDDARFQIIPLQTAPMDELSRLPSPRGPVSFYHREAVRKGHVKGAFKPLETLFMGLISLDFFVGTDKVYGDPRKWDNPFYTSLKPWRRKDSDMWDFAAFLRYWGWHL